MNKQVNNLPQADNSIPAAFDFNGVQLQVIMEDGEPWFLAKDAASILGYSRPADAVAQHCKGVMKHRILTNGGMQQVIFINEPNLYRLIIRSKLPAAEMFEDWVVSEVLPTIRKKYMGDLISKGVGMIGRAPKEEGFFYIYDFGHILKVGIASKDPKARLSAHIRDLQNFELPSKLKCEFIVSTVNYVDLESAVKRRYKKYLTTKNGEWMKGVDMGSIINFVDGYLAAKEN